MEEDTEYRNKRGGRMYGRKERGRVGVQMEERQKGLKNTGKDVFSVGSGVGVIKKRKKTQEDMINEMFNEKGFEPE